MKKITALLLSLAMITSLSACGEKKEETTSTAETTAVTTKATTKATTQTTTKTTTTKIEENTSYKLDTEYAFHDISFKVCSEWDFKDGETPSWYANSTSFVMARYDIIEGATYFDIQEYVSGLEKNSDIKVNKATPITLFDNIDAAIIEMKYIANDVSIVEYCFMIEDELYCIGASGNISNYAEKIIDTIQIKQKETENTEAKKDENVSLGKLNALESAKSYIEYGKFSYNGLIGQLEYEQYSSEEAKYGADNCGADWNEEALESAKSYIEYSGFSYNGLYDQLLYEEFTEEQAQYGVDNCKADWMEEAAECAQSYIDYSSFSRQELYDQLIYEGFTEEQAEYGVTAVGY